MGRGLGGRQPATRLGECRWVRNLTASKLSVIVREVRRRATQPLPGIPVGAVIHLGLFVPEAKTFPRMIDGVELLDASRVLDKGG